MTAESSASNTIEYVRTLNMDTIIALENLWCPIFQPDFPDILWPLAVLKIAKFCKAYIVFISNRLQYARCQVCDIAPPEFWIFHLSST